jgi:hypothetical protein
VRSLVLTALLIAATVVAEAAPVDPGNPYGIAAIHSVYQSGQEDQHYVLCVDGGIRQIQRSTDPKFRFVSAFNPSSVPVPVSEIADWTWRSFRTHDGDLWVYHGYDNQWYAMSQPGRFGPAECGDPVGTDRSTLGDVKSQFR